MLLKVECCTIKPAFSSILSARAEKKKKTQPLCILKDRTSTTLNAILMDHVTSEKCAFLTILKITLYLTDILNNVELALLTYSTIRGVTDQH